MRISKLLLITPFICPFFLLSNKFFVTEFSAPITARVFKFCIHLERGQVYCGKENQMSVIKFCLLFPFFLFFISHSNVIHREICVKDFSRTTVPRVLKFGTNVGYDLLYCVKENQHIPLFVHYSFIPSRFSVTYFLASMRARVFKFCIHIESGQVYFSFFHLTLQCKAIIFLFSDLQTRRLYYLRNANKNKTPTLLFYYFSPRRLHGFSRQRNKSIRLYTVKKCVRLYCVTGNENQSLTDDKKLKVEPDTNC